MTLATLESGGWESRDTVEEEEGGMCERGRNRDTGVEEGNRAAA